MTKEAAATPSALSSSGLRQSLSPTGDSRHQPFPPLPSPFRFFPLLFCFHTFLSIDLAVLNSLVPSSSPSTISPRPRSDRPTYNHRPRHLLGKDFSIVDVSGWYKIPLLSIRRNRSGDVVVAALVAFVKHCQRSTQILSPIQPHPLSRRIPSNLLVAWRKANSWLRRNPTTCRVIALVSDADSAVARAVATMASTASLTEFYLSSVWLYKPKIVKRIIGHLVGLGCVGFID